MVRRALIRQRDALSELEARLAARRKSERAARGELKNADVNAAAEYARTVDVVQWLVLNASEREQVEQLADAVAATCGEVLEASSGGRRAITRRLADHFWCDVLAALSLVIREIQDLEATLKQGGAQAASEIAERAWREVSESRARSHGFRPRERSREGADVREERDHEAGLTAAVAKGATRGAVTIALNSLTVGVDVNLQALLLKVRVAALLMCPDPGAHQLVWDECFVPILRSEISSEIQKELTGRIKEFQEGMDWDRPSGHAQREGHEAMT